MKSLSQKINESLNESAESDQLAAWKDAYAKATNDKDKNVAKEWILSLGGVINEAFKEGDKVNILSKSDKKVIDSGVVSRIQKNGDIVINDTKNSNGEIVVDSKLVQLNESVNKGLSSNAIKNLYKQHFSKDAVEEDVYNNGKEWTGFYFTASQNEPNYRNFAKDLRHLLSLADKNFYKYEGSLLYVVKNYLNESVNEAEITSDDEFKEYVETVLKAAHGDDYDQEKADKTAEGILKDADGDYGAAVGMLTSGLGESVNESKVRLDTTEISKTLKTFMKDNGITHIVKKEYGDAGGKHGC